MATLQILPHGLAVNRIYLNADGETHDIVEGPLDTSQHQTPPYKYINTLVGRYANRIAVTEKGHVIEKEGLTATVKPVPNGKWSPKNGHLAQTNQPQKVKRSRCTEVLMHSTRFYLTRLIAQAARYSVLLSSTLSK